MPISEILMLRTTSYRMEKNRGPDHRILAVAPCLNGQLLNAVVIAGRDCVESPGARSSIAPGLVPVCGPVFPGRGGRGLSMMFRRCREDLSVLLVKRRPRGCP